MDVKYFGFTTFFINLKTMSTFCLLLCLFFYLKKLSSEYHYLNRAVHFRTYNFGKVFSGKLENIKLQKPLFKMLKHETMQKKKKFPTISSVQNIHFLLLK